MSSSSDIEPLPPRTTIADIAEKCGVSISTVSRALSDHPGISERRKQQIREVAKSVGFEPRGPAKSSENQSSMLVGMVVPSISNPFLSHLVESVINIATRDGYQLILCNSGGTTTAERLAIKSLIEREVDGLLLVPAIPDSEVSEFTRQLPTVVVTQKAVSLPHVCVSHEEGGKQVAEHFKELGRSSCLLIGPDSDPKFHGFRAYIQSQHVKNFRIEHLEIREWSENIIDQVQEILSSQYTASSIRQFDCIFAINDLAAIGTLHALAGWSCKVPTDMAVCGFDDLPVAKEVRPRLTSVAQPIAQIANSGFELLANLISQKKMQKSETRIVLKPHIVIRESTLE